MNLFSNAASTSTKVMFSQQCTCCPPSSFALAAIRSINDSPSNTLEHHRHFHLPTFHSNTLTPSYLINLYVKSNNIMLAAVNVQKDRKANLIEKGIDFLAR
jgi:hypothetical protein